VDLRSEPHRGIIQWCSSASHRSSTSRLPLVTEEPGPMHREHLGRIRIGPQVGCQRAGERRVGHCRRHTGA
jgi:hypothetical protein